MKVKCTFYYVETKILINKKIVEHLGTCLHLEVSHSCGVDTRVSMYCISINASDKSDKSSHVSVPVQLKRLLMSH